MVIARYRQEKKKHHYSSKGHTFLNGILKVDPTILKEPYKNRSGESFVIAKLLWIESYRSFH